MNDMLKIAYDYGSRAALQEVGVKLADSDLTPAEAAAWDLLPILGPGVTAMYAPEGRGVSRFAHNLLLSNIGGRLGATATHLAGIPYTRLGGIAGMLGGGYLAQNLSQDSDTTTQKALRSLGI